MKNRRRHLRLIFLLGIAVCSVVASIVPAQAVNFAVNSTIDAVDANPGNGVCANSGGVCTLRAAIMEANHTPGGGVSIIIPAGIYTLTIPTSGADDETIGDLDITASMSLIGAGPFDTIIDGNGGVTDDRVVEIGASVTVSISGLTIRNGGSANGSSRSGAGISSGGALTLTNSIVTGNNSHNAAGGGIFNSGGTVKLINSTVKSNTALAGGGIVSSGGGAQNFGVLSISNSTVSGNSSFGQGAGIWNLGPVTLINSTISGNSVLGGTAGTRVGGGISHGFGTLTMINSTISGNSAMESGGGIYNSSTNGTVDIFNSTITLNRAGVGTAAGVGGGVSTEASSTTTFQNTIIANNRAVTSISPFPVLDFDDCAGTIQSDSHNLMGVQNCTVTGAAPIVASAQLGSLKFNGGPTKTHALAGSSPAVDAGDCTLGPKPLTDQRGFPRIADGDQNGNFTCDIGAYEFGAGSAGPVDLDGDGKDDIAVYQTSTGHWFFDRSAVGFGQQLNFGGPNYLPVSADYDGDGTADTAVYDTTNGNWFIDQSTDGFKIHPSFGGSDFTPVPADYDGDGKTDIAVYETSSGHWFIVQSGGGFKTVPSFGGLEFFPVLGDYDGDGKADAAVYHGSTGHWFVNQSTAGFQARPSFGGVGFIPVPGDYDGDGKTDVAVYQESTGHWFFLGSTEGFGQHLNFGGAGFMPVAADYDGDGMTDVAVYEQGTGHWFIDRSTSGFVVHPNFGGAGFVPVLPQDTIWWAMFGIGAW